MSTDALSTDRRSFLKSGALAAAPIAALAPAAALAGDGALARLEDEKAIETVHRSFVRRVNHGVDYSEFLASSEAVSLDSRLRMIALDQDADAVIELKRDGSAALMRQHCSVELHSDFTGNSTIEQMMRFQGQSAHRHSEPRVMETEFIKRPEGWRIARVRMV